MDESAELRDSDLDWVVERGETYDHADHGSVEVTGIWKGVTGVDEARETAETGTMLVRYATDVNGEWVDEFVTTLDEFLEAIE